MRLPVAGELREDIVARLFEVLVSPIVYLGRRRVHLVESPSQQS